MDDLVKRLRNSGSRTEIELHEDREEAADRIEADAARITELEVVLTGMLRVWDEVCKTIPALTHQPEAEVARAALGGKTNE